MRDGRVTKKKARIKKKVLRYDNYYFHMQLMIDNQM